jgi:hypothetical protein
VTSGGGPRGALLRGVAVTALVLVSLLRPAGASPVLAADDALSLVSTSTYSLVPAKGLVHVTVDVTATNNKPNKVQQTPNGTLTTSYFFDAAAIVLHAEATAVRASAGKTKLATKVTPDTGFAILKVSFANDLHYKQSTKFRVDYDLPGGAPRSDSDIRVGTAFATFYAWAFGDHGDVRIVIPAGFTVETTGSTVNESVKGGVTTLAATGINDPGEWYAVVVADRHDGLTRDRIDLAGGEHLVIRAWPEDTEWRTRVRDLLRIGLPVLVDKIGLDWPVDGDIEVAEVHTPLLEGYSGVFYTNEDRIEISEDLDELTIIHEASHAWFNANLFVGRWIDEGFADEYASRTLDEVSAGGLGPDPLTPTSDGAVDLNAWDHPGRIDDVETSKREHFGYEASWTVIRALTDEIGEDSMRKVLAAANVHQTAYVGAAKPETVTLQNDWRRFLDLLQVIGDSKSAEDLFRRWIVSPDQEPLLDARVAARTAYATLLEAGRGWQPGYVVRDPMGRWEFASAAREITKATEVLAIRDQIAERAAALGVAPPDALREAYETATGELDSVRELAASQLTTATAVKSAADRVAAERDLFTSIGLVGEDPAASVAVATTEFAAGDTAKANATAGSVDALLGGAADSGRTRALMGGLAGAGVLVVGFGGVVAVRRRRRGGSAAVVAGHARPDVGSRSPNMAHPYATLGDPRRGDAAADGPAEPGRDEGDDT